MNTFDNEKQFFGFINKAREEKRNGATAVGIFGSRRRGDHTPGKSDIDMMVEKDVTKFCQYSAHDENNIQVVRAPKEIEGNSPNDQALRHMQSETRWVWKSKK